MLAWLMVLGGTLLRLVPHLPNFAPISATALFGGAHLNKRFALVIPLVAVAFSDYLLLYINPFGNPVINFDKLYPLSAMFHSTTLFVWGSFVVSGLIGLALKKRCRPSNIVVASLAASIQFFLITNLGVWATTNLYSRGFDGLTQSYIMGLPFFKWTLIGDLFFSAVFFTAYELALKLQTKPSPNIVTKVVSNKI